jgi:hypothetical protein
MNIQQATRQYERWLAVGDLHVENYGTWLDAEGRLVWDINDFDEVFPLPYTIDLVRLATSAWLAIELGHLSLVPANACTTILEGYTKGLEDGGEPFVLAEKRPLLREAITSRLRGPTLFWEKFTALPTIRPVPAKVLLMLKQAMPERGLAFRVAHRRAGLGSRGRERFTAIAGARHYRSIAPVGHRHGPSAPQPTQPSPLSAMLSALNGCQMPKASFRQRRPGVLFQQLHEALDLSQRRAQIVGDRITERFQFLADGFQLRRAFEDALLKGFVETGYFILRVFALLDVADVALNHLFGAVHGEL